MHTSAASVANPWPPCVSPEWLRDSRFRDQALFLKVALSDAIRVVAFDVFDTVLVRSVCNPRVIFQFVGSEASALNLIEMTPEQFIQVRVSAERRVLRRERSEETTLYEIYDELAGACGLSKDQEDRIRELELAIEAQSVSPAPGIRECILLLRQRGKRVIFVSDMYLPTSYIERLLTIAGIPVVPGSCYVSSESAKTKRTGRLFEEVLRRERVRPNELLHCGNDQLADGRIPRRLGVRIFPLTAANPTRYERVMDEHSSSTGGLSSLLAGAARLTRLSPAISGGIDRVLDRCVCGVVAPVLIAYVWWLLASARKLSLDRLYFVSRDGQILYRIAQILLAQSPVPNLSVHYLFGGRQAWHLAGTPEVLGPAEYDWMLDNLSETTVRQLLARVGIEIDEVRSALDCADLAELGFDRPLGTERRRMAKVILESLEVAKLIRERSTSRRGLLRRYLIQNGFGRGYRAGVVDIGWTGRMQRSFANVLSQIGDEKPVWFYFGMNNANIQGVQMAYAWNATPSPSGGSVEPGLKLRAHGISIAVELFCSATHGRAVGFREAGSHIVPLLDDSHAAELRKWGVLPVQKRILQVAANLPKKCCDERDADLLPMVLHLLRAFWTCADRDEVKSWSGFPVEDQQSGGRWTALATPYSIRDLVHCVRTGHAARHSGDWVDGSLALTPALTRSMFYAVRRLLRIGRYAKQSLRTGLASPGSIPLHD